MERVCSVLGGMTWVLVALALASCATVKPRHLPVNRSGYRVDCTGPTLSWSHCYQQAGKACPHGYAIAQKSDKSGGRIVAGDLFDLVGVKVRHRRLLIECKRVGVVVPPAGTAVVAEPPAAAASAASPPRREGDDTDDWR